MLKFFKPAKDTTIKTKVYAIVNKRIDEAQAVLETKRAKIETERINSVEKIRKQADREVEDANKRAFTEEHDAIDSLVKSIIGKIL